MSTSHNVWRILRYPTFAVATFLPLQALLVVMHEFTHSTVAWSLGAMYNPADIVWGNPLLMTGWDEGVQYARLFAQGQATKAAIIGVSPLVLHAAITILGLVLLLGRRLMRRPWLFHLVFWFVAANIMELTAYILMRGFSSHGDTGLFNRGLGLSPWWLFTTGALALVVGYSVFFRRALPRAYALFAPDSIGAQRVTLALAAFVIFLWGSGIRVMACVSGPQWLFGLLGPAAFCLVLYLFWPKTRTAA